MKGLDFDFLKITFIDVIDILLVALLIYYVYSLIRNTLAVNLILGMFIIILCYFVVSTLNMRLMEAIINKFISVGIISLVVIFQPEIRRFLLHIGKSTYIQKNRAWYNRLFGRNTAIQDNYLRIKPIMDACKSMKKTKTGALLVFL